MWDDHRFLAAVANLLYALGALALMYALLMVVIRLPIFPLREVSVTGKVAHTTHEQVEAIVRDQLRGNFFTVDLEAARSAFEKLPWVRGVRLRRAWPDRLEVALEEHVALARWSDIGLVNIHGEVFEAATSARLPVFVGPQGSAAEMAAQYRAFAEQLAAVGRAPAQVRLSQRRAWQIKLDDGDVLELGRQDLEARLARFTAVYTRTVGRLPPGPHHVDLRYPNGFALRQRGLQRGAKPA
jgi:cell division protein FtsQ